MKPVPILLGIGSTGAQISSYQMKFPQSKFKDTSELKSFHHVMLDFDAFPPGSDHNFDCYDKNFPAVLNADLGNHPLPWNQGPLLPFLPFLSSDSPNWEDLFANYTAFQHDPN